MGLIVLTTLICLAHLSAATCPKYRPLTADQSCQSNRDCQSHKSCCNYSGSKFCVSTNPDICIDKGKTVKKGETIILEDNCSECTCQGYDDLICLNDGCYWPKQVPSTVLSAATCPNYRPLSADQSCQSNQDCQSHKSCCNYSGSKFCVSTNPDICIDKGKIVKKGESIILKDKCSECTCQGYDDLICTNDGCYWPKYLPNTEGCYYGGIFRSHGSRFKSIYKCNTCFCNNGNVACTRKLCISPPVNWFRRFGFF